MSIRCFVYRRWHNRWACWGGSGCGNSPKVAEPFDELGRVVLVKIDVTEVILQQD